MESVSGEVAEVVHDYVHTPEEDFFLVVGLISALGESRSDVIENPYEEPHPEIVLSCQSLGFAVVDSMFQVILAYPQQGYSN